MVRLAQGVIVIDDSYNASPAATRRALDVLRRRSRAAVSRCWARCSSWAINRLRCTKTLAARRRPRSLDLLIAVGGDAARALVDAAVGGGLSAARTRHLATTDEAADAAAALIQPGDLVLVKGSHGIRTDKVVDRLKTEFA